MTALAPVLLLAAAGLAAADSTETIAARYLYLTFAQQYDALKDVYAEDVFFVDPTGDVWQGSLAQGLRGADKVIALQKSWGLTSADFAIDEQFAVGEYALFRGQLTWTTRNNPVGVTADFMTVIRVVDGRVAERHDYGNYLRAFGGSMSDEIHANAKTSEDVGTKYFQAYLDQRHDVMEQLYAPEVSFQDPTAAYFGGPSSTLYQGRDSVVAMMDRVFQPISHFAFDVEDAWFSNHHAVFMGTVRFTLIAAANGTAEDVTFEHSAVFVITVVDGQVVAHRDFVDYSTFRDQLQAAGS